MAVLLEKQFSFIFNSDPASGSQSLSADGSSFQVTLDRPLSIPRSAVGALGGVVQASIWNTSPNIAAAFNNNIFQFTTAQAPAGTYTLTIPDGLYSVDGLNTFISAQLVNLGLPASLFTIGGDYSTQKTLLTIELKGDDVDFTVPNSVNAVLGFNAEVLTAPSANYSFYSENTAAFNRVNSFVLASNFVSQGIPVNDQSRGIIASVPINVAPGSQIAFNPQNVVWFDASELIGSSKLNMTFRLLNQNLVAAPAVDFWSFVMVIKYSVLLSTATLPLKPA